MKSKILILLLAFVLVTTFAFAGAKPEVKEEQMAEEAKPEVKEAPKPAEPKFTLTFSSVSVPDDAHTKAMYVFKEELERLTNGEIRVDVYPGGQLFTQEQEPMALRRGTLDMALIGPNWFAEYVPYTSMFAAAYMFRDYKHMSEYFNGPLGQKLYDDVARITGFRPLATYYLGLNLRDIGREVRTPQDMKGVKLRMPNTPAWLFMGKALGANPTPISFTEVYMALKTGTVDGQDNPLPTDKNAKFYEVTKYIILTDHYVNPIMPTINEVKWNALGPDYQAKVLQAVEKARQFCDETNLKAEAELVEFFKQQGMTIITPDKEAFMKYAQKMYLDNKEISGTWKMELFDQIQAMIK
jgi:tripartite ATP-independent transporter DctP family solute receptor